MENVTDICELSDENLIVSCLKERFMRGYIYVSNHETVLYLVQYVKSFHHYKLKFYNIIQKNDISYLDIRFKGIDRNESIPANKWIIHATKY